MLDTTKTNKLSIYMIKAEYTKPESILKDLEKLKCMELSNHTAKLYTNDSHSNSPKWINNFFHFSLENVFSASAQALYLTQIKIDNDETRFFAISFGIGHFLLKPGVIEERFGLKVVLNTIDSNRLRSIVKKNMSNLPKQSREQISTNSVAADFGIDVEQDLVLGITGNSKIDDYGKTITGC